VPAPEAGTDVFEAGVALLLIVRYVACSVGTVSELFPLIVTVFAKLTVTETLANNVVYDIENVRGIPVGSFVTKNKSSKEAVVFAVYSVNFFGTTDITVG
jgi:hypothetical protein